MLPRTPTHATLVGHLQPAIHGQIPSINQQLPLSAMCGISVQSAATSHLLSRHMRVGYVAALPLILCVSVMSSHYILSPNRGY
jgi:hypothetical protein